MIPKFKIKKVHPDAKLPIKATEYSIGYDCFAVSRKITDKYIEYDLGFIAYCEDPDYYIEVYPRSSITKKHLMLKNSVGIIDPDYRDTIKVRFASADSLGVISEVVEITETNNGYEETGNVMYVTLPLESDNPDMPLLEIYEVGERICQLVIRKKINAKFEFTDDVDETERKGGFGSTGNLEI